jgi:hypothetical protein
MPSLARTLGSIPRALAGAAADLRRGADAAAVLPALVEGLATTVLGLRSALDEGVAGLRADVRGLHEELAGLRPLPDGLEALRQHLARVETSVGPVEGLERELRDGVATVIARLDVLLDGIGAMRADLSTARTEIAPVDDDLAAVERAVKDMAPALGDVRDEITALRDDLSSLPLVGRRGGGRSG